MISTKHLRDEVIIPALKALEPHIPYSDQAVNLLLGTCAQESAMGKSLIQVGGGPALGIFQMEPFTFNDICSEFLYYRKSLMRSAIGIAGGMEKAVPDTLIYNLRFAAAMCRIHYFRAPGALPSSNNVEGMANYWKSHYNTVDGAGKPGEFVLNYNKLVLPHL